MSSVVLRGGGGPLTLAEVRGVAREHWSVHLDDSAKTSMRRSFEWVQGLCKSSTIPPRAVYSVNTGLGSLAGRSAFSDPSLAHELSRRLIMSNACGVGAALSEDAVRAMILLRANSLASGFSGVRVELVQTLLEMLNEGVYPVIPECGSLGASGDLAPLAHLALVLSRANGDNDPDNDSGEAFLEGKVVTGKSAMARAGIARLPLLAKEGLALINGTAFSTALAALAVIDANVLLETAEVLTAVCVEALAGFGDAFIDEIHLVRGQPGQIETARHIREYLAESRLIDGDASHDPTCQPPQDAYSLRCAPQVLGAVRDTIDFVSGTIERELNAVTDNPLIFCDLPDSRELKAVSGGNFHAAPIGFASDFLSIVLTDLASISERRQFRLTDGSLNRGLPDMLVASQTVGLDCGYMVPQYVSAALVSDCKALAHPDSVDSIPTSANQEDHVSMAANAARHVRQVVSNVATVLAIETLMSVQALELRLVSSGGNPALLSPATRAVIELVRSQQTADGRPVAHIDRDIVHYPNIRTVTDLVSSGHVAATARSALESEGT